MRIIVSILIFTFYSILSVIAQNEYLVKTSSPQKASSVDEEELFIEKNFPLELLNKWTPGTRFMFIPNNRNAAFPVFSDYESEKDVDNYSLKNKILSFVGTEEKVSNLSIGTNYSTRFIFECDSKMYYHEIKNMRLDEITEKNPRAAINGLIFLKDVDKSKELLLGQTIYIQTESARIDDANSYSGYKEVPIPKNMSATVTAIGVGNQNYPVKIVFQNPQGQSYYLEVAISRTNSGMDISDFQADKKMKYFANAISLTDKATDIVSRIKSKYLNHPVYPKKTLEAKRQISLETDRETSRVLLMRYTPLTIKAIEAYGTKNQAIVTLEDQNDILYQVEVDLKYDVIIKNEKYIEDLFCFEDIRKKYPGITVARWKLIANGNVESGMSTDECRLSLGNPFEIQFKKDHRFETWFYNGKTLEFESGTLLHIK